MKAFLEENWRTILTSSITTIVVWLVLELL